MKVLCSYLGPSFTYNSLIEDVYIRTQTGATERAAVHAIIGLPMFPALLKPLLAAFFDRHLYGVEDGEMNKKFPLLLAFNSIRQEILELVPETKRNATVRVMKESTEMVDAVTLTEKGARRGTRQARRDQGWPSRKPDRKSHGQARRSMEINHFRPPLRNEGAQS